MLVICDTFQAHSAQHLKLILPKLQFQTDSFSELESFQIYLFIPHNMSDFDNWVPAQFAEGETIDMRAAKMGPKGYKEKGKRKLDEVRVLLLVYRHCLVEKVSCKNSRRLPQTPTSRTHTDGGVPHQRPGGGSFPNGG